MNTVKKAKTRKASLDRLTCKTDIKRNRTLYLVFIPVAIYYIVFSYMPMAGIVIAFQDFKIKRGIFGSPFVGFDNFRDLFNGETFGFVMRNTTMISLLNLTLGFLFPIIIALLISEVRNKAYKRTVQTISYTPHFVAAVVVTALVKEFLSVLQCYSILRMDWNTLVSFNPWMYSCCIYDADDERF